MEPLSVFRTIWRQRWLAIPAIVLTLIAAGLVFVYGPREYESSISYALVDPQVPTNDQLDENPALKLLNSNNPYLRSSDPNLIASVLITRLNAEVTQETMKKEKLSDSYEATPGEDGAGLIVNITASGDSSQESLATTRELGRIFQVDLRSIQKVNGADDRYLFTSIVVDEPYKATEKLSSRLRTVIIVIVAGIILVFGAVSLGNAVDRSRRRRLEEAAAAASDSAAGPDPAPPVEPEPVPEEVAETTTTRPVSGPSKPRPATSEAADLASAQDAGVDEDTTDRSPARHPVPAGRPAPRKRRPRRPASQTPGRDVPRSGGEADPSGA